MLVALDGKGGRKVADAGLRGCDMACPDCFQPVVVRAGSKVIPHFAHQSGTACREAREAMRKRREANRKAKRKVELIGQETLFDFDLLVVA